MWFVTCCEMLNKCESCYCIYGKDVYKNKNTHKKCLKCNTPLRLCKKCKKMFNHTKCENCTLKNSNNKE